MIKWTVFAVLSIGLIFYSRKSMKSLHSHGFFRFFAFESILALLFLNLGYWFHEPFSILQIASWLLLLSSIILVTAGFYLLHNVGKPKRGIEETTVLVKRGVFRYIRHPLYSSLLLLGWGIFLKDPSMPSTLLVLAASGFLLATAKVEETENMKRFGSEYAEYMKTTKMLIPFLF